MIERRRKKAVIRISRVAIRNSIVLGLATAGACLAASSQQAAAPLPAATIDLQADRQMFTPISTSWSFSGGDDPRWADPGFDDSKWKVLQPITDWDTQGFAAVNNFAWFRFRLRMPASTPALVLLMPALSKSFQIFADGQLAGQVGSLPPDKPEVATQALRIFTLPLNRARQLSGSESEEILVAIRVWQDPQLVRIIPNVMPGPVYAGSPRAVKTIFQLFKASNLLDRGNDYTQSIVSLIVGAASLLLFFLTRRGFYAWFTLTMLLGTLLLPQHLLSEHFGWGFLSTVYAYAVLDFFSYMSYIVFILAALGMLRWRLAAILAVPNLIAELGPILFILGMVSQTLADGIYAFSAVLPSLFLIGVLLRAWHADVTYAKLLFFPFVLNFIISAAGNVGHYLEAVS